MPMTQGCFNLENNSCFYRAVRIAFVWSRLSKPLPIKKGHQNFNNALKIKQMLLQLMLSR